jgi:hypothetical protein
MSDLSDLIGGGGGGSALEATASGTLANGDLVAINGDGTVSVTAGNSTYSTGTAVSFGNQPEFSSSAQLSAAYDTAQGKIVLVSSGFTSRYGTAIVGTVSGTSISFGTPVTFASVSTYGLKIIYEPDSGKMVVLSGEGNNGKAYVGTVSGTSISFGSPTTYDANLSGVPCACIGASNKIFIAYNRNSAGNQTGNAIIGTISGTSISFGSSAIFSPANDDGVDFVSCDYNPVQNRHLITYQDDFYSDYGTAIVATVSGTSISFGTKTVFHTSAVTGTEVMYHPPSQKMLIVYYQSTLYAKAATISGTSVSFGSQQVVLSGAGTYLDKNVAGFVNDRCYFSITGASDYGYLIGLQIEGTTVVLPDGSAYAYSTTGYNYLQCIVFDTGNNKIVNFVHNAQPAPDVGSAFVTTPIFSNSENYIGVSDGAYSNGATATIQIVGSVDDAQSGLTAATKYYVQPNGSLSSSAGDPVVFAGTAVSSTKLIVKG